MFSRGLKPTAIYRQSYGLQKASNIRKKVILRPDSLKGCL
jgi:hypothetical protein